MTRKELINHIRYAIDIGADITLTNEDGEEIIRALEQKEWRFYYDHGYAQAKRDLQEPKTGHWIEKNVRGFELPYCSECGSGLDVIYHYPFCPNCGAKMAESEESD